MKSDRYLSLGIGAVLAFLLSFGSIGCLATGFGLDADMAAVALTCGLAAVGSGLLAGRKRGGLVILGLLTAGIGFFCFNRTAREELNDLIRCISDFYYRAYGWNWLWHGEIEPESVGYPLSFLGILVATQASWTVVRREDTFSAVLAALLPLGACLVVTDTVPHGRYLYLLILGLLLLILTAGLRRSDEGQANTLALMAALPLALALGGLFLAVPEESYVNKAETFYQDILARFPDLTGQVTGNSVTGTPEELQVDLRKIGPLNQRYYPVMDVVAPVSGTMYLRGQDFDLYDGTGWTATSHREEAFSGSEEWLEARGTVTIATLRELDVCYVPYYAAGSIEIKGGMVENPQGTAAYGFALKTLPEDWKNMGLQYLSDTWSDSGLDERYLELPEDTKDWAEELLESILPEDLSVATDKAEVIAAYVRGSAKYHGNTPKMPGDQRDFVRWFLTESDTGYCTHFASATAVLLRAAGIPARYVTGYMFQSLAGTPVTVRANQAHAWVEYYEPRLGMWLVLESTPSAENAPSETEPTQTQSTQFQETTGDTTPEDTTLPNPSDQEETTKKPVAQKPAPEEPDEEIPEGGVHPGVVLMIGAALAVLLWGQRRLRLELRRRKAGVGSKNQQALIRWQELELLYRRLGQTPPEDLEELAQKARFSQHQLTVEDLRMLDAGLAAARELCGQKPWYKRLVDRWFYAAY